MSNGRLMQEIHPVHVGTSGFIAACEDIFAGNPSTDIVNMANYGRCTFMVMLAAGATGTATLTVESCDTVVPGTATAIPFTYWVSTTADTFGDATTATATGFATTAGANAMYVIEINSSELSGTDKYVRLTCTEVVDSPVDGMITCLLSNPRYSKGVMPGALV